jgi:hypothetical protein
MREARLLSASLRVAKREARAGSCGNSLVSMPGYQRLPGRSSGVIQHTRSHFFRLYVGQGDVRIRSRAVIGILLFSPYLT